MVRLDSTARLQIPASRGTAPEPAAAPASRTPLIIAAVVGGLVLVGLLAAMFSGPKERRTQTAEIPQPLPPDPGPRPLPRPNPVDPVARDLEELDARTSLLLRQDKIPEVAGILKAARGRTPRRMDRGVDERLQKLDAAARRLAAPLLEQREPR